MSNPVPRLIQGTNEYNGDIRMDVYGQDFAAYFFLEMPLLSLLFGSRRWRQDLADSCAYAFAKGVSDTLSKVYSLEPDTVFNNSSDAIRIQFLYPPQDKEGNLENFEDNLTSNIYDTSGTIRPDDNQQVKLMSDQLWLKYKSLHENGKNRFHISLDCEPVSATLHSIFCFPCFTRSEIQENPDVRNFLRQNLFPRSTDPTEKLRTIHQYISEKADANEGKLKTTVEVQVLVECKEKFQVRDGANDVIVQGSEDGIPKKVLHLVRLEKVVTAVLGFPFLKNKQYGDWQITDIDDLVSSKPWIS